MLKSFEARPVLGDRGLHGRELLGHRMIKFNTPTMQLDVLQSLAPVSPITVLKVMHYRVP